MPLARFYRFYRAGFASMTLGRTLWRLIGIKLLIMFGILKIFFFPDVLATHFATDAERAEHVLTQLVQPLRDRNVTAAGEGQ